jgi:4-amino-4-deoxy-L-arabinose transferase-like glycosyltransferase
MNLVWWFMNSSEQTVDEAPWYRPALPYWCTAPGSLDTILI